MGWKVTIALVACVGLTCACEEPAAKPKTIVLRGKAATGAHVRSPLAGGYVGVLGPQGPNAGHWIRYGSATSSGLPSETTTSADGSYTYEIDVAAVSFTQGVPTFIAVSDAGQTLTMLSEIPQDLIVAGASVSADINPTTTAAGQMICPGGAAPPPANTWCYSKPETASADQAALVGILDGALAGTLTSVEVASPPSWNDLDARFLNDPATFTELKTNLTGRGIELGAATPSSITSSIAPLPLVHPFRPTSTAPPSSSGGGCRLVWNCGTSSQCASVFGAKTGSVAEPDATTCASICKSEGACTCQGC